LICVLWGSALEFAPRVIDVIIVDPIKNSKLEDDSHQQFQRCTGVIALFNLSTVRR